MLHKTRTSSSYMVNAIIASDLAAQGARPSTAIVITCFYWNIPASVLKNNNHNGLHCEVVALNSLSLDWLWSYWKTHSCIHVHYVVMTLICADWPRSSWWMLMPRHRICDRAASLVLTWLWLQCNTNILRDKYIALQPLNIYAIGGFVFSKFQSAMKKGNPASAILSSIL